MPRTTTVHAMTVIRIDMGKNTLHMNGLHAGVLSKEHVHMFAEIPPHIAVSDFVRRVKGRSSHRVQMEFPDLRKRYWGRHLWFRGYFCTNSGNITADVILQYLRDHEPTGVSR